MTYFKRKVDRWLAEWKSRKDKSPALIVGIRQCGKTESIMHFAESNYVNVIRINFWDNPEYADDFEGPMDVGSLISNISLCFPEVKIDPSDTLLFFDEIQECPKARLAFKNFKIDGRYDVIGSGSYLGINGYAIGDSTPVPTGYEDVYHMNTLDFEEFLWANGYTEEEKNTPIMDAFVARRPVPDTVHNMYMELFVKYICVGGFPDSVKKYVESNNLMESIRVNRNIIFDMKSDFGRRRGIDGKPVFKPGKVARIQKAFDLIPTFLAKENKRYITSKITTGSSADKRDAIEYLRQSHIVNKVHNLENPSLPLAGNVRDNQFKLFPEDIGIVTAMYGNETIIAINQGKLGMGKGAIYEAMVFDSFNKAGIDTYYFAKESGLEIDFVIAYEGESYLVEAKAKTGNSKSSKTVMSHPDHYGKTKLLKIGEYNVGEEGDILTIPQYMSFFCLRDSSTVGICNLVYVVL